MTLEAVVHQQQGLLSHNKDLCTLLDTWGWDFNFSEQQQQHHHHNSQDQLGVLEEDEIINGNCVGYNFLSNQSEDQHQWDLSAAATSSPSISSRRPKRRRARSCRRNQEEIESQRMTHIAVERKRRKQMNEYLSVLKSLMPHSYSQRGDQASIVGGAINVVKELEHNLQYWLSKMQFIIMSTQEKPFGDLFTFPQYSTTINTGAGQINTMNTPYSKASNVADIEATMVESCHANLKIRSIKRPKQLLTLVSGLQQMRLNILHLNVITSDPFVLYSLTIKAEDDAQLSSADEIARAIH